MTIEEKMEYARKTYPAGTKFISPYSGKQFISKGIVHRSAFDKNFVVVEVQGSIAGKKYVFHRGEWAKIVHKILTKEELITKLFE